MVIWSTLRTPRQHPQFASARWLSGFPSPSQGGILNSCPVLPCGILPCLTVCPTRQRLSEADNEYDRLRREKHDSNCDAHATISDLRAMNDRLFTQITELERDHSSRRCKLLCYRLRSSSPSGSYHDSRSRRRSHLASRSGSRPMSSHLSIPLLLVEGDVEFNSPVSLLHRLLSPMPMPPAVVPNLASCITAASPVPIISDLTSRFSDILSGELLTPNAAPSTWLPTGCYCAICAYMKAIRSARATIHVHGTQKTHFPALFVG